MTSLSSRIYILFLEVMRVLAQLHRRVQVVASAFRHYPRQYSLVQKLPKRRSLINHRGNNADSPPAINTTGVLLETETKHKKEENAAARFHGKMEDSAVVSARMLASLRHASPAATPMSTTKACVPCRARKTKCDAASVGLPCSGCVSRNCTEQCVISARKRRRRLVHSLMWCLAGANVCAEPLTYNVQRLPRPQSPLFVSQCIISSTGLEKLIRY